MGKYVAENTVKKLISVDTPVKGAKVALVGFTFKENCPDTRNTKVIDIYNELETYGITPMVYDPVADAAEAKMLYGIEFVNREALKDMDAIIIAVGHKAFLEMSIDDFDKMFKAGDNAKKVIIDVKGILDKKEVSGKDYTYWRL